jgi:hypothetical protein
VPSGAKAALSLAAALVAATPASAGPPFLTDDPEPVAEGHWELYAFSIGGLAHHAGAGFPAAFEANYGALPNLQLHAQTPLAFSTVSGAAPQYGYGDTEFGAKFRFVTPGEGDWRPQLAVYPLLLLPTGDAARGLGTGRTHAFLPLWLKKDWGNWTTYGGGGWWLNPGPGNKDYWFAGWLLERRVSDTLALAGEIFHQTAFATGGVGSPGFPLGSRDMTGFNLGGVYDLSQHYHLLFSAGRGIQNAETTDTFTWYLGLQATF